MAGSGTPNLTLDGSANQAIEDFNANGGTVVFDGTGTQSVNSGGKAFHNLTIAARSTLELDSDVIVAVVLVNLGTLGAHGHKIIK